MIADDNNGASVNEYSVKSTTSDVSSLSTLPYKVEDYIFVHRNNCNYTNALLQTMHPDIEIVCENIGGFSNVSPYPHSYKQPMLNPLRSAVNFVTNKVVSKIKIGLATLLSIPWYNYQNSKFVEIIKTPDYESNVTINTQNSFPKFFINRNDLIGAGVRPNKQIFADDQKQKYFNDMLDFYNNSSNYKTTSPYLRSVEEPKRFNEVLGGKRTKKRPKRMRKSTKKSKRRRGTRKRTNKKR